jgi:hypothetical protein
MFEIVRTDMEIKTCKKTCNKTCKILKPNVHDQEQVQKFYGKEYVMTLDTILQKKKKTKEIKN